MAVVVLGFLLLLLAITGPSCAATYCVCKDGGSNSVLQKNIDYACGNGANCSPIHEKGACFDPNTVKDHCNYAVNSYFQNKGQAVGSCDFAGTATTTQTLSGQSSACVYPTSASSGSTSSTGTSSTESNASSTGFTPGSPFTMGPMVDNSNAATHLFFWPFTLTIFLSASIHLRI